MKQGAIAFYAFQPHLVSTLANMGLTFQDLYLDDVDFAKKHGYVKEGVLLMLITLNECWGFLARTINKRDGSLAWKIMTNKDTLKEVSEDDIYLVFNLEDYDFNMWDEMTSNKTLARNKAGNPVRQVPQKSSLRKLEKKSFYIFKNSNILHQLVECGDDYLRYANHPFNTDNFKPYQYPPTNPFDSYYKSFPFTTPKGYTTPKNYIWNKHTLHAVPFLRNNIKPTKLSVWVKPKKPIEHPNIFFNFPANVPLINP